MDTPKSSDTVCMFTQALNHAWSLMLFTAFSIKVLGLTQAYMTRPKGSLGSCKSVLVSRLS